MAERLRRAAGVCLRLLPNGHVQASLHGRAVDAGPHGLAIFEALAQPMNREALLALLQQRCAASREELEPWLQRLLTRGLIQGEDAPQPRWGGGWVALRQHATMLDDRSRSQGFVDALRRAVRPDDVVLDLGCGTGLLAITAAKAGARKVYAVEASDFAELARVNIAANDPEGRITLLHGWSSELQLPERATLLCSEIVGHEPLSENILAFFLDARRRLLQPNARLIPHELELYALPLALGDSLHDTLGLSREQLLRYQAHYDMDCSALDRAARRQSQWLYLHPSEAQWIPRLGAPLLLARIALHSFDSEELHCEAELKLSEEGALGALLLYSKIVLDDEGYLNLGPSWAQPDCSWKNAVWVLGEPMEVRPGQRVGLHYSYTVEGGAALRLST
ncbi:MAG: 50S ribosomal protein L11 methyltransferase [Myxococcota bacterium]|jgi:protein arginine N-methyltransferase 1|nr:50S ribosomal protein L11 methyltransferase [Myxococcota bacterium]